MISRYQTRSDSRQSWARQLAIDSLARTPEVERWPNLQKHHDQDSLSHVRAMAN